MAQLQTDAVRNTQSAAGFKIAVIGTSALEDTDRTEGL